VLTCHAFHNGLEVRFAVFRVLSSGAIQYALYVAKAQTTRAHVSRYAAVRVVVVFYVNRFGFVFFAVIRSSTILKWRRFQVTGQHYLIDF